MFFYESEVFLAVTERCREEAFLEKVAEKYHYRREDREQIRQIAGIMQDMIRREGALQHNFKESELLDEVVITLGGEIDRLQDRYSKKGELSSAYMIEILSGEILLLTYAAYNEYVAEKTPYHVARYYFPGSEKDYPLTVLPGLLLRTGSAVTCNESCCMLPKQSVAFLARFTKEDKVQCRGICMDCTRKDCPNRSGRERLLPYGYARIFGKELL